MKKRLALNITTNYFCNQKCFFCVDDIKSHLVFLKKDIDKKIFNMIKWWIWTHENIVFTSWEPTLNSNFWKYIKYAKKLWYKDISLISNGSTLINNKVRYNIINSWLDEIVISIHWLWKVHDKNVWINWMFEKTLRWLYYLLKERNNSLKVSLSFVLNKSNYRIFYKYISFFFNLWVDQIIVNFLRAEWFSAWLNYWLFYFKYTDFINYCLSLNKEEINFINKYINNRKLVLIDILPCILNQTWISVVWVWTVEIRETFSSDNWSDPTKLFWKDEYRTYENKDWKLIDNNNNNKVYIDKCSTCTMKIVCEWIYRDYIDNFWDNGIQPIK